YERAARLLEWVAFAAAMEAAARRVGVPIGAVAVPDGAIVTRVCLEQALGRREDAPRRLPAKRAGMRVARLAHRPLDVIVRVALLALVLVARHGAPPLRDYPIPSAAPIRRSSRLRTRWTSRSGSAASGPDRGPRRSRA